MRIEWPGKKLNARLRARRARKRRRRRWRLLLVLAMLGALGFACVHHAPSRYNPTRPIDLTESPTFVTGWKLRWAHADRCFDAIAHAGITVARLPDEDKGPGCGFEDVGRLDDALVEWGDGVTLTCPMLARLAQWERHVLQPAARKHLGAEVVTVRHYGTYACRNVNHASSGRRSQHATANAIDIAGFVLADGAEISVLKHWDERGSERTFLRHLHKRACSLFDTVLGPDYNDLHRDHFHFDMGGYGSCR